MNFEEFEKLEKFNVLTKEIEKIQMGNNKSSSTDQKEKGGLTIKRNGTIERT